MTQKEHGSVDDWIELFYRKYPEVYRTQMDQLMEDGEIEARNISSVFEKLNIGEGKHVLDLGCGIGRHSVPLAEQGYIMTGCDISPYYLQIAKEKSKQKNLSKKLRFLEGDIYKMVDEFKERGEKFDAVMAFSVPFGYNTENDMKLFRMLADVVEDKGVFLLQTTNRDWILSNFANEEVREISTDMQVKELRSFNIENSTINSSWSLYQKVDEHKEKIASASLNVRLYSFHEIKEMMENAGWTSINSFGDMKTLEPSTLESRYFNTFYKKRS